MNNILKKWKAAVALLLCVCMIGGLTACADWEEEEYEYEGYEEASHMEGEKEASEKPLGSTIREGSTEDLSKFFPDSVVRDKQVKLKGDGTDTVTMLIYMNGSNLESDSGEATTDLSEILAAGYSDQVNILVQTMGTKKWENTLNIASDRSQIYHVEKNGLALVKDDLGQLDCTKEQVLSDFIAWGVQNYPADRYILHFWDHGGGPVYGFGYDEWVSDENAALTIDEMQNALKKAGVFFDFVGMDCCLMSCLEVCCAFYDFCDYMILSEDFESGLGWNYTDWVKELYKNPSIPTVELGKKICDDMVIANEQDKYGDKSSMAIIDEAMLKILVTAWTDFAYANEKELLGTNYSRVVKRGLGGRILPRLVKHRDNKGYSDWNYDYYDYDDYYEQYYDDEENLSMAEYYITDIMEVASTLESEKSAPLSAAINATLTYVRTTESDAGLTGIAVSLPYGDSDYYKKMKSIFTNIGMDKEYVNWLQAFTKVSQPSNTQTHESWDESWDGWDEYEEDYNWDEWEYSDSDSYGDEYWCEECGFNNWNYSDSWNQWCDDNCDEEYSGYWDDEEGCYWDEEDEDWYYSDWD